MASAEENRGVPAAEPGLPASHEPPQQLQQQLQQGQQQTGTVPAPASAGEAASAAVGAGQVRASAPANGLDAIVADHRVIKQLFDRYDTAATTQAKLAAGRDIVRHISRHASAEERTLYPWARDKHPTPGVAKILYDRMVMDDQVNKQMLDFLDSHVPSSEAEWQVYDATVAKMRAVEEEHLATEESLVIEPLRSVLDAAACAKLGRKWADALANAPTHPHPGGPSDATGAKLLHPVVGLIDRVRDALFLEPAAAHQTAAK